jgi:endonuclease-3
MPRKSPRSRNKPAAASRIPRAGRTRAKPGERRRDASTARSRSTTGTRRTAKRTGGPRAHALQGARERRALRNGRAAVSVARRTARVTRRPRVTPPDPARVQALIEILERLYPEATTALDFATPLQLLVATILSAQCTDKRVNLVTPGLFARYPDAAAFAGAETAELESMIRSTGFFRNKTRAIRECAADIVARHGGEVPRTLEELTRLRGVGRKTANVVLGNAFGIPGVVVDTHVARLSLRLGLTRERDPVKIEHNLMAILPTERWSVFSHWLILHGRSTCIARKPRCSVCPLLPHCPRVGVTTSA